jgi:hypothetical protein
MLSTLGTFQSIIPYTNASSATTFTLNTSGGVLRYNMEHPSSVTDSFSTKNGSVVGTANWNTTVPSGFSNIATSSWVGNGANGNYISAPSFTLANKNVSISAWVYCTGASNAGDVKWWGFNSQSDGLNLFQNRNTSNYAYDYILTWSMSHNTWHHVVCIDDFSNLNKIVYVDGTLINTVSYSANQSFFLSSTSVTGARIGAGYSAHQAPQGYITDFRVYNRILSQAEITAIYQKTA